MKSPLIGTGFYATKETWQDRREFYARVWRKRVGPNRQVVIADNSSNPLFSASGNEVRIIPIFHNLGHIGDHIGKYRPHLLGWSMSWILPALVAHSEQRDFIYVEQDCLVFGDWERAILDEAADKGRTAMFGKGVASIAACEQSLFWIHRDYITEFVNRYLNFPQGDGVMLPEEKFKRMMDGDKRIAEFSIGVGRDRPLPIEQAKTDRKFPWYAQHLTPEEMQQLKDAGLI